MWEQQQINICLQGEAAKPTRQQPEATTRPPNIKETNTPRLQGRGRGLQVESGSVKIPPAADAGLPSRGCLVPSGMIESQMGLKRQRRTALTPTVVVISVW